MTKNAAFYISCLLVLILAAPMAGAVTTVTLSGPQYTNSTTPSLTITTDANPANSPQMSFSCNGTAFSTPVPLASPYSAFNITDTAAGCAAGDGTKMVSVKVTDPDPVTPTEITSAPISITLDTVLPTTTFAVSPTSPNGLNGWYIPITTITLTASDSGSGVQTTYYCVDSANSCTPTTVYSSPFTLSSEGTNYVRYYSTDQAGNSETIQISAAINFDPAAQLTGITLDDGNASTRDKENVKIALAGTEADFTGDACQISGDGITTQTRVFSTTAFTLPWTPGDDGTKTISAQCTDIHGNTQTHSDSIILDTVAIVNSISINGSATDTNLTAVTISINGESTLAYCRFAETSDLNASTWTAYAATMNFTLSSGDGTKTVYGQCKDTMGNESGNASDSIRLDTTVPSISQFNSVPLSSSSISLTWTASDGLSGLSQFILFQNGAQIQTFSGTRTDANITGLAALSEYSFSLIAKDNAGNYSTAATTATVTLAGTSSNNNNNNNNNGGGDTGDTVSPIASWVAPLSGQVVKGTVKLRVNATDNAGVASVKFYIDTDNVIYKMVVARTANVFETDWNSTAVSNGLHTLIARATDTSGNPKDVQIPVTVNNSAVNANDSDQNSGSENDSLDNSVPFGTRFSQADSDWFSLLLLSNFKSDSDATAKLMDARQKLLEAQAAFDSRDEAAANQKLEEAIEIINPLKAALGFGSLTAFDSRELTSVTPYSVLQLQQFGLNSELAVFSLQDSTLAQGSRELFVFEHTNENGEKEYFVKIVVKIKNTSGFPQDLEFIEIIPKALLQSAGGLVSDYSFSVLRDDPLVQWSLSRVPSEKEIRISYGSSRVFTLDEVRQMLDGKTLSEFQNRPLLVTKKNIENKNVLASTPWLAGFSLLSNAPLALIGFVILLWFFVLSLGYWNLKRNDPVFSFETASAGENKPNWFSRLNKKTVSSQPAAKPQAEVPLLWNNNAPVQKNALAKLIEGDKRPNLQPRPIQGEPVNWWKENKRPPAD